MICSKCNTPKQSIKDFLGNKLVVPIMCKCREEEVRQREELEKQRELQIRLNRLLEYSMMDKQFLDCTFQNFQVDNTNRNYYKMALGYCEKWLEMKQNNIGMMLFGEPGTGKSFLSFAIANNLIHKYVPVMAISSIGLLSSIKDTYNKYGKEGEAETIKNLKNASLLVLDDLGAENSTAWTKEKLYEIIDMRYRDGKPMIVTTNLTTEQLKAKLTSSDGVARTYDRLIEMCTPVEVKGVSRRAKRAEEKKEIFKDLLR